MNIKRLARPIVLVLPGTLKPYSLGCPMSHSGRDQSSLMNICLGVKRCRIAAEYRKLNAKVLDKFCELMEQIE
jgi:hypothetical protein